MSNKYYDILIDYLESDLRSCLIDGEWGVGKTFILKNLEAEYNKRKKQQQDKIFMYFQASEAVEEDLELNLLINFSQEKKSFLKIGSGILNEGIKNISGIDFLNHFKSEALRILKDKMKKEKNKNSIVLIIDEIERISKYEDIEKLFNQISKLKEDKDYNIKIILSMNSNKLNKKLDVLSLFNLLQNNLEIVSGKDNIYMNLLLNNIIKPIKKEELDKEIKSSEGILISQLQSTDKNDLLFKNWIDKLTDQTLIIDSEEYIIKQTEFIYNSYNINNIISLEEFKVIINKFESKNIRVFKYLENYLNIFFEILINHEKFKELNNYFVSVFLQSKINIFNINIKANRKLDLTKFNRLTIEEEINRDRLFLHNTDYENEIIEIIKKLEKVLITRNNQEIYDSFIECYLKYPEECKFNFDGDNFLLREEEMSKILKIENRNESIFKVCKNSLEYFLNKENILISDIDIINAITNKIKEKDFSEDMKNELNEIIEKIDNKIKQKYSFNANDNSKIINILNNKIDKENYIHNFLSLNDKFLQNLDFIFEIIFNNENIKDLLYGLLVITSDMNVDQSIINNESERNQKIERDSIKKMRGFIKHRLINYLTNNKNYNDLIDVPTYVSYLID